MEGEETPKNIQEKEEIQKDLEELIQTFSGDMEKALAIKHEKEKLVGTVEKLRLEEGQLRDLIEQLKGTRDKLQAEIKKRESQEMELKGEITDLKDEKAQLVTEKKTSTLKIKDLQEEKKKMTVSLGKTNDLIVKLKHQIDEFDKEIKS